MHLKLSAVGFLQARRLESSPACFALSSRCFLARRFPPSREEIEAIPAFLKWNWVETSPLFFVQIKLLLFAAIGVFCLYLVAFYGHYKYLRKDEFTKLRVGFYFIILIKRTLGNYLLNQVWLFFSEYLLIFPSVSFNFYKWICNKYIECISKCN